MHKNDIKSVGIIIFLLPLVSARKPHIWELVIIPINAIALKIPLFADVIWNSHATGMTKLMAKVSMSDVVRTTPDMTIKM